ncbi:MULTISPECIES: hypothetical protein [Thermodesulfobacterium]|jgi:hypothetical protein|nr:MULTISPECIES: hypothetical protein [Thermodesulfobacterium]
MISLFLLIFPLFSFAIRKLYTIDLTDELCKIWIEIKEEKDFVSIKTCGRNEGKGKVFYEVFVEITKSGKSGKSSSKQFNNIFLNPGEEKCFSQSKLNLFSKDKYNIVATLYKNGNLIKEKGFQKDGF